MCTTVLRELRWSILLSIIFADFLKFAMLWTLNNMDNFWNLNFRESKIKVFASPSCELVRKSNMNQCSSSHLIARASMTMQEQNYRIVLPPARGPMVSMCHLKCVGPYGVHVSPKMCGPLCIHLRNPLQNQWQNDGKSMKIYVGGCLLSHVGSKWHLLEAILAQDDREDRFFIDF